MANNTNEWYWIYSRDNLSSAMGRPELTSLIPIVTVNIDQQPETISVLLVVTWPQNDLNRSFTLPISFSQVEATSRTTYSAYKAEILEIKIKWHLPLVCGYLNHNVKTYDPHKIVFPRKCYHCLHLVWYHHQFKKGSIISPDKILSPNIIWSLTHCCLFW